VIKRQFGHVKVRYRGLKKNTAQLTTLFALSNLWMARTKLLALDGQVRPSDGHQSSYSCSQVRRTVVTHQLTR
jgi:hypothetical protein